MLHISQQHIVDTSVCIIGFSVPGRIVPLQRMSQYHFPVYQQTFKHEFYTIIFQIPPTSSLLSIVSVT